MGEKQNLYEWKRLEKLSNWRLLYYSDSVIYISGILMPGGKNGIIEQTPSITEWYSEHFCTHKKGMYGTA